MRKTVGWIGLFALGLPLIAAVSLHADFVSTLQQKLKAFYENKNRVGIHLILNQPEYVAGDTAFFKAHVVHGVNRIPLAGKRILNIELIGKKQQVLIHNRIVVAGGFGSGQFILPETLEPGPYALIAYGDPTDRATPPLVFQTELWIAGEKQFTGKRAGVELFPEGGNWIAGIRTKVAVSMPGGAVSARVKDSSGKTITEFTTQSQGLGTFFITQEAGEHYYIESPAGRKELGEPKPDGVGLHLEPNQEGTSFRVTLEVPKTTSLGKEEFYLVLTSHGSVCFSKTISFDEQQSISVTIPGSDCTEGVAQLTVFSGKADVLAERLVFLEPRAADVQIAMDAPLYTVRKPVKADFRVKDFRGLPVSANLSVTVVKEDLFSSSPGVPDFQERVLIESDLVPGFASFPDGNRSPADLSDYLITRKWGVFQWKDVFAAEEQTVKSSASPYYFRGNVFFPNSQKAVPDSTVLTFYLNRNDFVYVVYTKKNGEFEFPLFMDFSNDVLLYTIHYKGKEYKDAFISLQKDPSPPWPLAGAVAGAQPDPYALFSNSKKPILKSFAYYLAKSGSSKNNQSPTLSDYTEFEDVDVVADMDKYKKFGSMSEVLLEVVPAVKHKKTNEKNAVRVFLQESAMFAQDDPLYFIDGVVTDSTDYFLSLDPDDLSRIKVLRSEKTLHRFGDLGKNGMVIVETKTPDKANLVPGSKRVLSITGVTPPLPFVSPDYSTLSAYSIPDLRATLFWKPQLATDSEGKSTASFFTGDATGTFVVRVEGMTSAGQPFSKIARFTVSMDRP